VFTRRSSGAGVFSARASASRASGVMRCVRRSTSQSGKSSLLGQAQFRFRLAPDLRQPFGFAFLQQAPSSWRCDMPRTRDSDSSTSSRGEMRRAPRLSARVCVRPGEEGRFQVRPRARSSKRFLRSTA
jgi:hypothetical protein